MEKEKEDKRPMKDWVLAKESELRIETFDDTSIEVQLLFGVAEVFGTELAKSKHYTIGPRSKIAIFTWFGCTIRIVGDPDVKYVSTETPMTLYLNTHVAIDQLRHKAECNDDYGPKVMVCGPTDVGKSTLCKLLLNYAVRMGRQPIYIDVDVGQGNISVPGSVGILPIERLVDIEDQEFSKLAALVYHYGHTSPGANIKLYHQLITKLAELFRERCSMNTKNKHSGCVINTCGWIDGPGYKALLHIAETFEVGVVLVLDNEKLYIDFQRDLPKGTSIVRLPKSGGVVVRSREYRRATRNEVVREYFYGRKGRNSFFPFSFDVSFSDVKLFKIGAPEVPESCLPIGAKPEDGNTQVVPVELTRELAHSLVSLSMATSLEEDLVTTSSAGFLCISSVDDENSTLTILSPAPSPIPRKFLLLSDIKFMDFR